MTSLFTPNGIRQVAGMGSMWGRGGLSAFFALFCAAIAFPISGGAQTAPPGFTVSNYVTGLTASGGITGLAIDTSTRTIYYAEQNTASPLRKIAPDRTVTTVTTNMVGAVPGFYPYVATDIEYYQGGVYYVASSPGNIARVDTTTGVVANVAQFTGFVNECGMTIHDGVIYATQGNGSPAAVKTLNLATLAQGTLATGLPSLSSTLEYNALQNVYYFTDVSAGRIMRVTPAGVISQVAVGTGGVYNFAVEPSGAAAYLFNGNVIRRFDTATGVGTNFVTGLTGSSTPDLVFGPSSSGSTWSLYLADGSRIVEVAGFSGPGTAPSVTTNAATGIVATGATFNGSVNPNGIATTGSFRYGTDPTLAAGTNTVGQALGTGTGAVPLTQGISGLLPHTTYYFRASATNSAGTTNDGILSFTTLDRAPVADNDSFPAPVTAPPFTFDVRANDSDPDGDSLTISAVTNGAYGTVTTDGATVTYTPGSGYHGNDTFTYTISDGFGLTATATVTIYRAPDVVTSPATSILPTGAVLNGTANPLDLSTDVAFEVAGNPTMTGAVVTSSQNIGNGFAAVPVSFPLTGLAPNTTYYFRIAATSAAGTSRGAVLSFITPVIVWGGAGANAGTGTLDATIIPADTFTPVPSPVVYTNVAGQGYDVSTTTYRLGAVGPATFPATVAGSPAWFFQGSAPNNSNYSAFTFRFFQTGTSNPVGVTGIRFRLEDAETGERFANFSYWDAIGNKITVPFTDSMFVYSNTPTYFNNGYGVINGAGYEGGTQTGKWIDIDLSLRAISGFELLSHRQTSSAGSVIMTGWGGGPQPMNVWRQAQFGGSWTEDSISGDFADPNGDGVINLLAYAFGIPPLGRPSGGMPVVGLSGGYLTVTFTRPLSVTDLTYLVEVSSDMTTWHAGSVTPAPATRLPTSTRRKFPGQPTRPRRRSSCATTLSPAAAATSGFGSPARNRGQAKERTHVRRKK